jgi:competence protein ComEC
VTGQPRLAMLDVGQGDSFVLHRAGTREAILVDCPPRRSDVVLDYLSAHQVEQLGAVVVSHLHDDHYGGIDQVLGGLDARELWVSLTRGHARPLPKVDAFLRQLRSRAAVPDVTRFVPRDGDQLSHGGVTVRVLGPCGDDQHEATATDNPNHASTILHADLGGMTALLGGDAPPARWDRLIEDSRVDLRADVLAMPHHGAAFAQGRDRLERLLNAVSPQIILVSVGFRNRYGHPRDGTLRTLGDFAVAHGARLVCSQLNGHCLGGNEITGSMCAGTTVITVAAGNLRIETERQDHRCFTSALPGARCQASANESSESGLPSG